MLTILVILFLAYSFYAGARRGVALQAVYTIGYLVSFIIARMTAKALSPALELWVPYPSATPSSKFVFFKSSLDFRLDSAFYYGVSFVFVLAVCWCVVRIIGLAAHDLEYFQVNDERVNKLGGGFLNFICAYVFVFLLLYLLALIPVNSLQETLGHSPIAILMVRYTPILSNLISNWWIVTQ